MNQIFKHSTLNKHPARIFIFLLFTVIIILNLFSLNSALVLIKKYKKLIPYQGIGYRHRGLNKFIPKGTKYVGYYIGGNKLGYGEDAKYFAQAQYILAPLILDFNNLDNKYTIFSEDERTTLKKIKEKHLLPLRRNKFGVILTIKKDADNK